jgi:uncharacterized protein (DUF58 family)
MISREILKKIKRIDITTKYLVNTILQGEYLSTFKGRGIEFTEVREYVEGDDVRTIDWNVTARMNFPYVKTFIEERELQVIFAADMSGSLLSGSKENLKNELLFEFVATLGLTANQNNDRVGFMGFTLGLEKYIPPKKGKKHILRIIREILYHEIKNKETNINFALNYLNHILKKKSTIFFISDFYDKTDFYDSLKSLRHYHDIIAVIVRDDFDYEILPVGLIPFFDIEKGQTVWLDTFDKSAVDKFKKESLNYDNKLKKMFNSLGIDYITITCGKSFINDLIAFFKKRERRLVRG